MSPSLFLSTLRCALLRSGIISFKSDQASLQSLQWEKEGLSLWCDKRCMRDSEIWGGPCSPIYKPCNHEQVTAALWASPSLPVQFNVQKAFARTNILRFQPSTQYLAKWMSEWIYKMNEKINNWFCLLMPFLVTEKALLMIIIIYHFVF